MAWNKPTSNTVDATSSLRPTGRGKMPRLRRGLLAGVIVVLGAGIAAWFFSNGEADSRPLQKADRGLIKEVAPAVTNRVKKAEKKKDVVMFEGKEYPRFNAKGCEAYVTAYGVRYHSENIITSKAAYASMTWAEKPFKRHVDQTIAQYLVTEPGTFFVGDVKYGPNFTKQFLKFYDEPIEILPEDSDDVKELKQAVIETKKELMARYKNGEDVAEIIQKTRDELKQLGAYKHELEEQFRKIALRPDMTEQDLDDYVTAANMMLEERGCTKLTMPDVMRRNVQMREKRLRRMGIEPHDLNPKNRKSK